MTDEFYIESATLQKAAALQQLTQQLMTESDTFLIASYKEEPKTIEQTKQTTLVLYHDEVPIGIGSIESSELGVAILSAYQGRGLGRFLTEALIDWGKQNQLKQIWLDVQTTNQVAVQLYKSLQFTDQGQPQLIELGNNKEVALQKMVLELS